MTRRYVGVVAGTFSEESGTVEGAIGRHPNDRKRMTINEKNGKPAVTHYRVLQTLKGASFMEFELETGRTHQIRAHLAGTGHPLIGDYKYGRRTLNDEYCRKYGLKSQLLHAYRLEIPEIEGRLSYLSGKEFTAPLPYLFQKILKEEHVEENK